MIHPVFAAVPDRGMAEACSDIFVDGAYKYATASEIVDEYGTGFPPVPSHMAAATATYLEDTGSEWRIRTQFIGLNPDLANGTEVADLYSRTVGEAHDSVPALSALGLMVPEFGGSLEGMQRWCMEATAVDERRILAAHFVARTAEDGKLIDTLAYPKVIHDRLPLVVRGSAMDTMPLLDQVAASGVIPGLDQDALKHALNPLLHNDPRVAHLASAAMSTFLPPVENIRPHLEAQL